MSLIAWWPLTGHTNNYGTMSGELQATSSSVTYTDGKIGNAMYTGSLNLTANQWKKIIGNTISIAMWVYTREDGTYSAGTPFFGNGGMTKPNNRKFTMFHYNTKTTLHCSWQHDDQSSGDAKSTYWGCSYTNFFEINKWVHLCVVQDAATETITVYRNGEEYSTTKVDGLASFNIKSAAAAPVRNSIDYQHTNDIRIYDHALSAFEVKEIAKALIMHYNFDDVYAEPTTNLISGFGTLSRCTRYGNGVKIDWSANSGDTYFMMTLAETLAQGETYTLSFDCEGIDADNIEFRICNLKPYSMVLKNGKNQLTFVLGADIINDGRFFLDDAVRNTSSIFTITNIQLEKKDHPTPHTKSSRAAKTYNETALAQPTVLQNINYSSDSANGGYSLLCNNTHLKTLSSTYNQEELTLAAWVKPFSEGSGAIILGGAYLVMSGKKISVYCYDKNPAGYHTSSKEMTLNEWHHIAVVWDKEYCRGYIDGELVIEKACVSNEQPDTSRKHLHDKKDIGSENGTSRIFDGLIDDARVYNTALSQNDIIDLYKTKAYIIENGDIACGEFVEDCTDVLVTEESVFETAEIFENALPDGYEQLESISFDYVTGTSEPYINTGYNTTDIYQIDCDIEVVANANNYQFGQQQKGGWMYNGFYGTGSLEFNWAALTPRPTARARHTMTQTLSEDGSELTIVIDGVTWTTTPGTNGQGGDFYIFACRNGSNAFRHYGAGMTLYSFRIHEGYRTVRDFIPARRRSDGAIGLYDTATQMLYTNAGTGEFKAGPVVKNNEAMIYENGNIYGKEIIEI